MPEGEIQHFSSTFDGCSVDYTNGKRTLNFVRHIMRSTGKIVTIQSSYEANELIVQLQQQKSIRDLTTSLDSLNTLGRKLIIKDSILSDKIFLLALDSSGIVSSKTLAKQLMNLGLFRYAEPNYSLFNQGNQPNQYQYSVEAQEWALFNGSINRVSGKFDADIDALETLSALRYSGSRLNDVTVAVLDGGINLYHQAFNGAIWINNGEIPSNGKDDDLNGFIDDVSAWNFRDNSANVSPEDDGHGTHVSGIISARKQKGGGATGLAQNARIMMCKTGGSKHETLAIVKALKYAKRMGAKVVNMSLGSYDYSITLKDAVEELINADIPLVAAAGNDGLDIMQNPVYPATLNKVIAVANSDRFDNFSNTSNYSPSMCRIAAPGDDIYSTLPNYNYGYKSGTSMSAPFVTATIALLKGIDPQIALLDIIRKLDNGADRLGTLRNRVLDGQRLNVYRTLFQPSEIKHNGVFYKDEIVNGRFRSSLNPYANSNDPGIDGKTYQTAFRITTMKQLIDIRDEDLNSHFRIMNNLDWNSLHPNDKHTIAKTFNGVLHGDGFTIKGFELLTELPCGLFLKLGSNAIVEHLRFSEANIKGSRRVGVLAASMQGSQINDVHVEGTVTGRSDTGGLVGESTLGQFTNCYYEGTIKENTNRNLSGSQIGGITGSALKTNFFNCHVQAEIKAGERAKEIGGIAGRAEGNLTECYSYVSISGDKELGGLVGILFGGLVSYSYSEGVINGASSLGGLFGVVRDCRLKHCYSISTISRQSYSGALIGRGHSFSFEKCYYYRGMNYEGGGGLPRDLYQLQSPSNFDGWFLDTKWHNTDFFSPAISKLPRSHKLFPLHQILTVASHSPNWVSNNQKEIERTIWTWLDYPFGNAAAMKNRSLVLTSDDNIHMSVRFESYRAYTRVHPWVKFELTNVSGNKIVDWMAIQSFPIRCNTNENLSRSVKVPGFYRHLWGGDMIIPQVFFDYCR
ncbi:S8 family serine peptidase [Dyadobacter sp. 22481]|uniref:S8 family serine peptidase n=1 Tax=Dyadobacter sp. 22481 TaxID=3453926 RepID=UPI003F87E596